MEPRQDLSGFSKYVASFKRIFLGVTYSEGVSLADLVERPIDLLIHQALRVVVAEVMQQPRLKALVYRVRFQRVYGGRCVLRDHYLDLHIIGVKHLR